MLTKGLYNQPTEEVSSDTPAIFPPLPTDTPKNRLALPRDTNPCIAQSSFIIAIRGRGGHGCYIPQLQNFFNWGELLKILMQMICNCIDCDAPPN